MTEASPDRFAVYAVRKREATPLIQTEMTFKRLMDDIVVPFNSEETFFIDGAPVKPTDLDRIKIIKHTDAFTGLLSDMHWQMREGEVKTRELYGKQYHVRIEALLREAGEDVTTQIVKAYNTVIKPKLKDYLPNREALLEAAVKVFAESIKTLSGA
jgi:hypothetical protein